MLYQKENSLGKFYFECRRYENFRFVPHMHRHHELMLVRKGKISIEKNGQKESARAGEMAWLPSNCVHAYETEEESLADVCIFSEDYVPHFVREIRGKKPDRAVFSCREGMLRYASETLFLPDEIPDLYRIKSALYGILGEMHQSISFMPVTAANETLMDQLIRYVAENYTEDISLRSAARALGYEEHYLSRCFHSMVPIHFSRYVNLYRVDAAAALLQNSGLSLTQIAGESGFQSIRSFNRVFLEITGKTPSQYLK